MSPRGARTSCDALIVGGGVIGFSIADRLAREGFSVRLLEAQSPGSGASGAAAGMLAPVAEAPHGSALYALGRESLTVYPSLCRTLSEETGIDPEFEPSGLIRIAFEPAAAEAFESRVGFARRHEASLALEWWNAAELVRELPDLARGARGACYSPTEAHLRPPLLVRALEANARLQGVHVDLGVSVQNLRVRAGRVVGVESSLGRLEATHTILAAGVSTPALLTANLPSLASIGIEPVRGQILSLRAPLPATRSIVWSPDAYFVPKRDGAWIVGATEERVGFDCRVTAAGVASLLEAGTAVFPSLAEASFEHAWAGLRPVSLDGLPWIGAVSEVPGLVMAAGHGRNGVLLAPATARIIAELLLGKAPDAAARSVSPSRRPADAPEAAGIRR